MGDDAKDGRGGADDEGRKRSVKPMMVVKMRMMELLIMAVAELMSMSRVRCL